MISMKTNIKLRNILIKSLTLTVFLAVFWQLRLSAITLNEEANCDFETQSTCIIGEDLELEDKTNWLNFISSNETFNENVLEVAKSQLGYKPNKTKYILEQIQELEDEEEPELIRHYASRYGHFTDTLYEDNNVSFISFVLNYANIPNEIINPTNNLEELIKNIEELELIKDKKHLPTEGDLLITNDETIGIITNYTKENISIIQSNNNKEVIETIIDHEDVNSYISIFDLNDKLELINLIKEEVYISTDYESTIDLRYKYETLNETWETIQESESKLLELNEDEKHIRLNIYNHDELIAVSHIIDIDNLELIEEDIEIDDEVIEENFNTIDTMNKPPIVPQSNDVDSGITPRSSDVNTVDTIREGITINLFDYWVDINNHNSGNDYRNGGINNGKHLKFRHSANEYGSYNVWDSSNGDNPYSNVNYSTNSAKHLGILKNIIEKNSYPKINGHFNRGEFPESLTSQSSDYLFSPSTTFDSNSQGRKSYLNLNNLFYRTNKDGTLNENGSYLEFDSDKYFAEYNYFDETNKDFKLISADKHGFFPFNTVEELKPHTGGDIPSGKVNHFLGMTLESKFYFPPNMQVDGEPLVFEFHGDDDLWVFIDDVLVLDLGGINNSLKGTIDFAHKVGNEFVGKVTLLTNKDISVDNGNKDTTIKQMFEIAGKEYKNNVCDGIGCEPFEHTIKVFWLERGANKSNFMARFNLPTFNTKNLEITKKVDSEELQEETYFIQVFRETAIGNNNYDLYFPELFSSGYSDFDKYPHYVNENGNKTFVTSDDIEKLNSKNHAYKIKASQKIVIPGSVGDQRKYYVNEVKLNESNSLIEKVTINNERYNIEDNQVSSIDKAQRIEDWGTIEIINHKKFEENNKSIIRKIWYGDVPNNIEQIEVNLYDPLGDLVGNSPIVLSGGKLTKDSSDNRIIWEKEIDHNTIASVEEITKLEDYLVEYKIIDEYDDESDETYKVFEIHNIPGNLFKITKIWKDSSGINISGNPPEKSINVRLYKDRSTDATVYMDFELTNKDYNRKTNQWEKEVMLPKEWTDSCCMEELKIGNKDLNPVVENQKPIMGTNKKEQENDSIYKIIWEKTTVDNIQTFKIVNQLREGVIFTEYELPKTGGIGIAPYLIVGIVMITLPLLYKFKFRFKESEGEI